MEIIPILSTIILVGTLSTFILAIFAYLIYKRRERAGRADRMDRSASAPEPYVLTVPTNNANAAPLAAPQQAPAYPQQPMPQPAMGGFAPQGQPAGGNVLPSPPPVPNAPAGQPQGPFTWEFRNEGFAPAAPRQPRQPVAPQQPAPQQPAPPQSGLSWN